MKNATKKVFITKSIHTSKGLKLTKGHREMWQTIFSKDGYNKIPPAASPHTLIQGYLLSRCLGIRILNLYLKNPTTSTTQKRKKQL